MCCFSGPIEHVVGTRIFARALEPTGSNDSRSSSRQLLAYAMTLTARHDVAMVLPLPVPPDSPEDSVRFLDLSGYPDLFDSLERAFPPTIVTGSLELAPQARGGGPIPKLVVHRVGSFEASFVPRIADFSRLDPRFRLPDGVWDRLPAYRDFGFAVFKLRGWSSGFFRQLLGSKPETHPLHPMAFEFPRRDPTKLFFPTVHIHDGKVHDEAPFDHVLYWQEPGRSHATTFEAHGDVWIEPHELTRHVEISRTAGLVHPGWEAGRRELRGLMRNQDVLV